MTFYTVGLKEFRAIQGFDDDDSNEVVDIPSVPTSELASLSLVQRITLASVVGVLAGLSVLGNVGTLFANQKRQLRPFFRSCLVSLAMSDLLTTVFMTVTYLAQFGVEHVQVWCLGGFLCGFIPFVTTGAILVSSMTLVGIALDRYFAVMRAVMGFWNPGKVFCCFCTTCIWGLSFGIASPMIAGYSTFQVYLLMIDTDDDGNMQLNGFKLVEMCVSDKESNAYYYIVVLAIIFIPTLVAFVWLNSIIANKLWIRRHSVSSAPTGPTASQTTTPLSATTGTVAPGSRTTTEQKQMEMIQQQFYQHPCHCAVAPPLEGGGVKMCTNSMPTTNTVVPVCLVAATTATMTITTTAQTKSLENNPKSNCNSLGLGDVAANVTDIRVGVGVGSGIGGGTSEGNNAKRINSREARHLRMFTIVLILMAVFILFRLPAWIFLIIRMYGTYTHPVHWILHFSFGILTLTSCVLNPLLYTFLAETIQYAMILKGKLCSLRHFIRNGCGTNRCNFCKDNHSEDNDGNANVSRNNNGHDDDTGIGGNGTKPTCGMKW